MKYTIEVQGLTRDFFVTGDPSVMHLPKGTLVLGLRGWEVIFAQPVQTPDGSAYESTAYTFWAVRNGGEVDFGDEFSRSSGDPIYVGSMSPGNENRADFHVFYAKGEELPPDGTVHP